MSGSQGIWSPDPHRHGVPVISLPATTLSSRSHLPHACGIFPPTLATTVPANPSVPHRLLSPAITLSPPYVESSPPIFCPRLLLLLVRHSAVMHLPPRSLVAPPCTLVYPLHHTALLSTFFSFTRSPRRAPFPLFRARPRRAPPLPVSSTASKCISLPVHFTVTPCASHPFRCTAMPSASPPVPYAAPPRASSSVRCTVLP